MRNYKSPNPKSNFLMIDKEIIGDLSADAYYLLSYLTILKADQDNSNAVLKELTNFGDRRLINAKNELIDKGYLDTKQVYGNKYVFYIGKESVRRYRASRYKKDNRHEQNQIKQVKDSSDTDKM